MIVNERYLKILNLLDDKGSITINEIVDLLNISESTVRRDLNNLDKQNKLVKVHGGAISNKNLYITKDENINNKKLINQDKKILIAQKAVSFIKPNDFVYIDAGTTTLEMINFIKEKNAIYITNGLPIAETLIKKEFETIMIGGKIKNDTEATVGSFSKNFIEKLNFTVGFFGTNGVSLKNGFTTPDLEESYIKAKALNKSNKAFVLCDDSKFNLVSSITFAQLKDACIITNKFNNTKLLEKLKKQTKVLEV